MGLFPLFHYLREAPILKPTLFHTYALRMYAENIQGLTNIREKFGRFRVLIVGRANAGKTTILQRICNSTENPEIYDSEGNKAWT